MNVSDQRHIESVVPPLRHTRQKTHILYHHFLSSLYMWQETYQDVAVASRRGYNLVFSENTCSALK